MGAAVLNVIEYSIEYLTAETRVLLTGALAVILIGIAVLIQTVKHSQAHIHFSHVGGRVMLFSALVIALLGFVDIDTFPLLVVLPLLLLAPVFLGFMTWLKHRVAASNPTMHGR